MNFHRRLRAACRVATALVTLCVAADAAAQRRARGDARAGASERARQTPPPDDGRAGEYLEEGDGQAEAGDWASALASYKKAAAANPRHAEALIRVGDASMSLGKYEDAFNAYREAVRVAPSNANAHYSLGAAYNDMGMHGDAFKPLVQAIRLAPDHAEANHGIGYAYLKQEEFEKALIYLKRAVRLKGDYTEAQLSLGLAYAGLGQAKQAQAQLKLLEASDAPLAKELAEAMRRADIAPAPTEPDAQESARTATPKPAPGAPPRGRETARETPTATPPLRAPRGETREAESVRPAPRRRAAQTARAEKQPESSAAPAADELSWWNRIKDSSDPEEFDAFLHKHPSGQFAGLARIRLRVLAAKRGGADGAGIVGRRRQPSPERKREAESVAAVVEPAPRPRAETRSAPTLQEAMKLLKEDFANKLTYTATAPGEDANVVKVTSEIVIEYQPLEFEDCRIEWRERRDILSVSLRDLDPLGIRVEARNKPGTTFSIPVWNLTLKTFGGKPAIRELKGDGSGAINNYDARELQFGDRERATRFAGRLRQAIDICAPRP